MFVRVANFSAAIDLPGCVLRGSNSHLVPFTDDDDAMRRKTTDERLNENTVLSI